MPEQTVPIVISGVGLLTPLGDSLAVLSSELRSGHTAFREGQPREARIEDFDAARYAAVRGMRVYNRTTQLAICAVKRALDEARLDTSAELGERAGLVMASTFGHLDTLISYDRSLVSNGLARTNPALMPLALSSAPGAATALAFHLKAFSLTLSDGSAGALDALGLACRLLRTGRADSCVVVSAFSPSTELSQAAFRAGIIEVSPLAQAEGGSGTGFGEAAVALVLERPESAEARGVAPFGAICSQSSRFASDPGERWLRLEQACADALEGGQLGARELSLVSCEAQAALDGRGARQALDQLLAGSTATLTLGALTSALGETLDTGGLLQTVLALDQLRGGDRTEAASGPSKHALVCAASHTGACSALLLARG